MEKKIKSYGILYLLFGKRNTLGTLTDINGQGFGTLSCGIKFKGPQRKTFYANQLFGRKLGRFAKKKEIDILWVRIRGKKEPRVKALLKGLIKIRNLSIERIYLDIRQPHNGCRPRKQRRK